MYKRVDSGLGRDCRHLPGETQKIKYPSIPPPSVSKICTLNWQRTKELAKVNLQGKYEKQVGGERGKKKNGKKELATMASLKPSSH